MNDEPKPISVVNAEELVRRIEEAKRLRAEGADDAIIQEVEPSRDEMRAILLELRQGRTEINTAKKAASKPKQPRSLDGLLSAPIK